MSYGKVHEEYWDGEKIEPLSDRAALLGLYLITGPHRNAIGCFKLGIGRISDVERFGAWGIEGVSEALREMVETGFIVRDDRTGWTMICNALVKDPIKGSKAAIHAAKLAATVPANSAVYSALKEILEPQLDREAKALKDAEGWPMRSPIEGVSKPKPSPSPLPEPEPSPEPEPEGESAADAPPPPAEPALPVVPKPEPEQTAPSREAKPQPACVAAIRSTPDDDLLDLPPSLDRRKACRLPPDWELPDVWRQWAEEERPDLDVRRVAAMFKDFWIGKSGKDATKTDWFATFRNWIRREGGGPKTAKSATRAALENI